MKANTKTIIVVAAIGFILLTGMRFMSSFRKPAPSPQAMSPFGLFGQPGSAIPGLSKAGVDATVFSLMSQYGLDMRTATYLAQAKIRVISQSNTAAHLILTFPDNLIADETITLTPGEQYTPTAAELEEATRSGVLIYNRKFSAKAEGADETRITLQYFVPYSAVPAELQQTIRGQAPSAQWWDLVPSAWAQESGEMGAGVGVSSSFGVAKAGVGALWNIASAFSKSQQNQSWMQQMDALQNCAQNPTNPVTQKAYQDNPAYREQTVSGVQQARSEVQQVTGMRFLNQGVATATGLVGGPLKLVTAPVSMWNDRALKDIADQQIRDVAKSVDCDPAPTNNPLHVDPREHADGTIQYHYHREGYQGFDEDDRFFKGQFNIQSPLPGYYTVTGTGPFKTRARSSQAGTKSTCQGHERIGGGGPPSTFQIGGGVTDGECDVVERGRTTHDQYGGGAAGFECSFHNLDFVNGGRYSSTGDGLDGQYGVCTLELTPQQK
ncbi:MAG: hypothetical protein LAN59_04280 [Acidobacteriia bacterium]|nr:hypothetical protein [Terriglobia bacterium]